MVWWGSKHDAQQAAGSRRERRGSTWLRSMQAGVQWFKCSLPDGETFEPTAQTRCCGLRGAGSAVQGEAPPAALAPRWR